MEKNFKLRLLFGIFVSIIILSVSCKKDDANPATSLPGKGDLNVIVCDVQETYYGGAEVFLYKSSTERTNDPQRTGFVSRLNTYYDAPSDSGAVFKNLSSQKYYVWVRYDLGLGNFITGEGESLIISNQRTKLKVVLQ